jgi:hypothetical protein
VQIVGLVGEVVGEVEEEEVEVEVDWMREEEVWEVVGEVAVEEGVEVEVKMWEGEKMEVCLGVIGYFVEVVELQEGCNRRLSLSLSLGLSLGRCL